LGFATHRDGGGKRPIPAAAAVLDRTSEWRGKFGNTHGSKGWWTKAKQGKMGASSARQDENRNMGEVEWKRWTYISIYVYIIYVYNIIYIYVIYIIYIQISGGQPVRAQCKPGRNGDESSNDPRGRQHTPLRWVASGRVDQTGWSSSQNLIYQIYIYM
jgi:hypothetical protein